jgi:hypothetical protein
MGPLIQETMAQWFMEAGAIAVEKGPTGIMGPSSHAYGGTRMGTTMSNVVTNVFRRDDLARPIDLRRLSQSSPAMPTN